MQRVGPGHPLDQLLFVDYLEDTSEVIHGAAFEDYPVLLDADGKVGQLYGAKTTPHMYVIDPAGTLRYIVAIDDDPWGEKAKTNYVRNAVTEGLAGKAIKIGETKPYGCSVKYKSK